MRLLPRFSSALLALVLAAPSIAAAAPTASTPFPVPPVYALRVTDIDDLGGNTFEFLFEIQNWTNIEAHGLVAAVAGPTGLPIVGAPPAFSFAGIDGNGRPLGGGNDDANFPPGDATGLPPKIGVFNTWGVSLQTVTQARWTEPTSLPGFGVPPRDLFGAGSPAAACGLIPGCVTGIGYFHESVDNGIGPDNVLDGFVLRVTDLDPGELLSLNLFLTNAIGAPIGISGAGNQYGFGVLNIFRVDTASGPPVWRRVAGAPEGPGANTGTSSSDLEMFESMTPSGEQFEVELAAGMTAPFADPADNIFGAPINAEPVAPSVVSQTVAGKSLVIQDNSSGADPKKRRVEARAKEPSSPNTIVGDPTVGGATLEIIANGTNPTSQVFSLPASHWKASPGVPGERYQYRDSRGENSPVTRAHIRKSASGVFTIKAKIDGRRDTAQSLDVVPPNDGTDGYMILEILGGDRYCVQFGADGKIRNRGARSFRASNPTSEGCPP